MAKLRKPTLTDVLLKKGLLGEERSKPHSFSAKTCRRIAVCFWEHYLYSPVLARALAMLLPNSSAA